MSPAKANVRWLRLLGWYVLWRAPFWRALPDFFDSPEYVWRLRGGFWSGMHNGGGHLPFQGTEYGPAAALFVALGGAWHEVTCIAAVTAVYGLAAYVALIVLWRRLFSERVALFAALLYPLLMGPGLADTSTYSMSALHAFLFGGSALLAEGLAIACHRPPRARWLCGLGAVGVGLATYTHVMALLWLSVPAAVGLAYVGAAPEFACASCASTTRERLRRGLLWAALPVAASIVGALLIAGAEVAHVHRAVNTLDGVRALVLRDWKNGKPPLNAERFRYIRRGFVEVTGGLGLGFFLLGLARWIRKNGAWSGAIGAILIGSALVAGREYVWGFNGRIYLPIVAFAVPLMIEAVNGVATTRLLRAGQIALLGLLFLQSAVTSLAVLGTRRFGPQPGDSILRDSKQMEANHDGFVIDSSHRTYSQVYDHLRWWFGQDDGVVLDQLLEHLRVNDHRLITTSETLRQPFRPRDGHLFSPTEFRVKGDPAAMMDDVAEHSAAILDAPLGREEYLLELADPFDAPSLAGRLERAQAFLDEGDALLMVVAKPGGLATQVGVHGTARDCVSRERYDAWELTAFGPALAGECDLLSFGVTDATRIWMEPASPRERYELDVAPWARGGFSAPKSSLELGPKGAVISLQEAERRLERMSRPFAALVAPAVGGVRLDARPIEESSR